MTANSSTQVDVPPSSPQSPLSSSSSLSSSSTEEPGSVRIQLICRVDWPSRRRPLRHVAAPESDHDHTSRTTTTPPQHLLLLLPSREEEVAGALHHHHHHASPPSVWRTNQSTRSTTTPGPSWVLMEWEEAQWNRSVQCVSALVDYLYLDAAGHFSKPVVVKVSIVALLLAQVPTAWQVSLWYGPEVLLTALALYWWTFCQVFLSLATVTLAFSLSLWISLLVHGGSSTTSNEAMLMTGVGSVFLVECFFPLTVVGSTLLWLAAGTSLETAGSVTLCVWMVSTCTSAGLRSILYRNLGHG